jgi:hypothetical protein
LELDLGAACQPRELDLQRAVGFERGLTLPAQVEQGEFKLPCFQCALVPGTVLWAAVSVTCTWGKGAA